MFSLRVIVDKAGRLVIPRALRSKVGLARGGEVEIEIDGSAIRIEPVLGSELSDKAGLLIIPSNGTSINDALVSEWIAAERQKR